MTCSTTSSSAAAENRVFTRLAALIGVRPGDEVLDVGCGTGTFTRVMAEAVKSTLITRAPDVGSSRRVQ